LGKTAKNAKGRRKWILKMDGTSSIGAIDILTRGFNPLRLKLPSPVPQLAL
jgi:hypothetical protein